uniref:Glycine-rich domain-containing protein n=1 Tax=viral metagenome TaxID=1070528 RepID=A0A6C0I448_9ZZZZ
MDFSKTQIIIGIVIIIAILLGVLFFLKKKESEGFSPLPTTTTTLASNDYNMYHVLYVKEYPTSSYNNVYDEIYNNYDKFMNNLNIHKDRLTAFKTKTTATLTKYIENPRGALSELQSNFMTINSDSGKIQDSCLLSTGKPAQVADWNKYVNKLFTEPLFLSYIINNDKSKVYIFISDSGFNTILYDKTMNDANKILRLADYLNQTIPGAFIELSTDHKDAVKDIFQKYLINIKNNVISNILTSTNTNSNVTFSMFSDETTNKFKLTEVYDLSFLKIITAKDSIDNIVKNLQNYAYAKIVPVITAEPVTTSAPTTAPITSPPPTTTIATGNYTTKIEGSNTVYTFTAGSGSLTFPQNAKASVLIVGGGGGGGRSENVHEDAGAGGGGGGSVGYGTLLFIGSTSYNIEVGSGGKGINNSKSVSGSKSTITGGIIKEYAPGGGYGGSNVNNNQGSGSGGSSGGGGAAWGNNRIGGSNKGTGAATMTYLAGDAVAGKRDGGGGGGGGAGGEGAGQKDGLGGAGGAGYTWTAVSPSIIVGCGGGGGSNKSKTTGGKGGSSIGGNGGGSNNKDGTNAVANTGSGGGGAGALKGSGGSGSGGVIIISVPTSVTKAPISTSVPYPATCSGQGWMDVNPAANGRTFSCSSTNPGIYNATGQYCPGDLKANKENGLCMPATQSTFTATAQVLQGNTMVGNTMVGNTYSK